MAGPGPRGEAGAGCGALRGAEGGALLVAAAPAPGSAGSNPRLEERRPSQPAPGLGERVSFCAKWPGALGPSFTSGYPGAPGAAACPKAQ